MRRTALGGAILAVLASLLVLFGQALNLDLERVALTGAALGAVIALVPDRTPLLRAAGGVTGFLVAWLGYGLRAQLLPDTSFGRALAVLLVVLLLMAVAVMSGTRVPLWSLLVGAASLSAAYEVTFMTTPSAFLYDSPTAATQMALAAGVGYLAASFLGPAIDTDRAAERSSRPGHPTPPADAEAAPATKLDNLLTTNES